jgi:hypothetical protein
MTTHAAPPKPSEFTVVRRIEFHYADEASLARASGHGSTLATTVRL